MNRLVKYLSVILKWRRFIFWNTFILAVVAAGVSFILPQRFTAVAQLLPPSDEGDMLGLSGILGGGLSSGRLGRLGMGIMGGGTASDLMVGILGSRTVVQHVAERCSVARYYRIKPTKRDAVIKQLRSMTRVSAGDDGIVLIRVQAKGRQLAADIANTYVTELDSFLRSSNISRGRNMRIFLERRIAQMETTLATARESLRAYQERHHVTAVDEETRAAVDAYATLKSKLIAKEVELGAYADAASADNPLVANLRAEVSSFRQQLSRIERGGASGGYGVGFGVSFESLPSVAAAFAARYQEFRIQQEAYAALYQQYEYARVLEARDVPAITVLDRAVPPEMRSFPRRARVVLFVFAFGLCASLALAFVSEYFDRMRRASPDEYGAWLSLRGQAQAAARDVRSFFSRKR